MVASSFAAIEERFLASAKAALGRQSLPAPPPPSDIEEDDDCEEEDEEGLEDQSLYEWPYGAET